MEHFPFDTALEAAAEFLGVGISSLRQVYEKAAAAFDSAVKGQGKANVNKFSSPAVWANPRRNIKSPSKVDQHNTHASLMQTQGNVRIEFYLEHENANREPACIIDANSEMKYGSLIYVDNGLPGKAENREKIRVVKHFSIGSTNKNRNIWAPVAPPPARFMRR